MIGRWSWIVFVLIGGLGVAMSLQMLVSPEMFVELMAQVGPGMPEGLGATENADFLAFMGFWTATALIGVNSLTVIIAATALRRGERWAAWAMLYWPFMFASHLVAYDNPTMQAVQVGWIIVSLGAIAATLRRAPTPAHRVAHA